MTVRCSVAAPRFRARRAPRGIERRSATLHRQRPGSPTGVPRSPRPPRSENVSISTAAVCPRPSTSPLLERKGAQRNSTALCSHWRAFGDIDADARNCSSQTRGRWTRRRLISLPAADRPRRRYRQQHELLFPCRSAARSQVDGRDLGSTRSPRRRSVGEADRTADEYCFCAGLTSPGAPPTPAPTRTHTRIRGSHRTYHGLHPRRTGADEVLRCTRSAAADRRAAMYACDAIVAMCSSDPPVTTPNAPHVPPRQRLPAWRRPVLPESSLKPSAAASATLSEADAYSLGRGLR